MASDAHKFGALDFEDLQSEREYKAMRTYGRSKSANILFTVELAGQGDCPLVPGIERLKEQMPTFPACGLR